MREVHDSEQLCLLCKALSSPVRIQIAKILARKGGANLNELAERLGISNSAVTAHVRALEEAGVVRVEITSGRRGIQKRCHLEESRFLLNLDFEQQKHNSYEAELPIGSYVGYSVKPTCGIATPEHAIGQWDDPRFFDDPERIYAGILWMSEGYLEYRLPNYIKQEQRLVELTITQELGAEAPGFCEIWPSDLSFSLNGLSLGSWTAPGDFGIRRGLYTPDWWVYGMNQYGLLKPIVITRQGTFIDGSRISPVSVDDLGVHVGSELIYRISAPGGVEHAGGLTLFGRGFGDYNHGILIKMIFEDLDA